MHSVLWTFFPLISVEFTVILLWHIIVIKQWRSQFASHGFFKISDLLSEGKVSLGFGLTALDKLRQNNPVIEEREPLFVLPGPAGSVVKRLITVNRFESAQIGVTARVRPICRDCVSAGQVPSVAALIMYARSGLLFYWKIYTRAVIYINQQCPQSSKTLIVSSILKV